MLVGGTGESGGLEAGCWACWAVGGLLVLGAHCPAPGIHYYPPRREFASHLPPASQPLPLECGLHSQSPTLHLQSPPAPSSVHSAGKVARRYSTGGGPWALLQCQLSKGGRPRHLPNQTEELNVRPAGSMAAGITSGHFTPPGQDSPLPPPPQPPLHFLPNTTRSRSPPQCCVAEQDTHKGALHTQAPSLAGPPELHGSEGVGHQAAMGPRGMLGPVWPLCHNV